MQEVSATFRLAAALLAVAPGGGARTVLLRVLLEFSTARSPSIILFLCVLLTGREPRCARTADVYN